MITYQIELETHSSVRLIEDDNPKAARPFDGGHIHYAPENYPARIVDPAADRVEGASERIVNDAAQWGELRGEVVRTGRISRLNA